MVVVVFRGGYRSVPGFLKRMLPRTAIFYHVRILDIKSTMIIGINLRDVTAVRYDSCVRQGTP